MTEHDDVIEGELVDHGPPGTDMVETPSALWIPKGKAAAALAGQLAQYDPEGRLSAAAKAMRAKGESESTVATMVYQFYRFCLWCYEHGLDPLPTDRVTVMEWITANFTMKDIHGEYKGRKVGRRKQPYSPNTVRLSLAAIARAHRRYFSRNPDELARYYQRNLAELEAGAHRKGRNRGAMPTPTAHEDVVTTMRGYARDWKEAGYREDIAESITVDELFAMVRTFDLETVPGLRDAFLLRLAAEIGRRNSELMALNWSDLKWQTPTLLVVTVPYSKTNQEGAAGDKAYVEADDFYCPELDTVLLGREWKELCASRGFTDGAVFRQVRGTGQRRKDGGHRGVILPDRMEKKNYVDVVAKAARDVGIDYDSAGDHRKIVPHSLRVFFAKRSLAAGVSIGTVCDQGGWSRNSPVVLRYDRDASREREGNTPGALIRRAAQAAREEAERKARGAAERSAAGQ